MAQAQSTVDDIQQRVFAAHIQGMRTMADGTIRVVLDLAPGQDRSTALAICSDVGASVAVARLNDRVAVEATRPREDYGQAAKLLKLSSFFRNPKVWEACGTDAQFREWLRGQRCCAAAVVAGCSGLVQAAHVRRIQDGAGTGIKPPYAAVPLCEAHHREQHQLGESAIGRKEWWDQQRIAHVEQWAWGACKRALGHASMATVPPDELIEWATSKGVAQHLPAGYVTRW